MTTIVPGPPSAMGEPTAGTGSTWRAEAERVARVAVGGLLAGLVGGFLVGGVGGRLAMRVVAVQTPDHYQGLTTDDGATTGEISLGGTLSLVVFVTLVGVLGGLLYVIVRPILPQATGWRLAAWGATTGVLGGVSVVQRDGVDYTVLGSPAVSVAMFVALVAAYGVVTAAVADRLLRPDGWARAAPLRRVLPALILLVPAVGAVLLLLVLGAVVVAVRVQGWQRRIPVAALTAVGRIGLVLLVGTGAVSLSRTIADVV